METRLKGSLHRFQLHHPPIRSRRRGEIKEFSREIMRIIRRDARAQDSCLRFTWSLEGFSAPPSWKNKRFTSWNGAVVAVCLRDASLKKKKKEKKICKSNEDARFFLVPNVVRKRLATGESCFLSLSLFLLLVPFSPFIPPLPPFSFSFSLFSGHVTRRSVDLISIFQRHTSVSFSRS